MYKKTVKPSRRMIESYGVRSTDRLNSLISASSCLKQARRQGFLRFLATQFLGDKVRVGQSWNVGSMATVWASLSEIRNARERIVFMCSVMAGLTQMSACYQRFAEWQKFGQ